MPRENAAVGLLCVKGYHLLYPQLRNADGSFSPITWDAALDLIASKVKDTLAQHGPEAVSGFMTQFQSDEPMGCYQDLDRGDDFVPWGNNMAEMHPVLFSRILETKRVKPATRIIDIATRRTPTTDYADLHVLVASAFRGLPQGPWQGGRATPGAPPTIPHTLQLWENCLTCHAGSASRVEIRTSHPERPRCRQCHVPE